MIELNKIYNEPCLETTKRMDNESIDCVITSPPYWQLRDYGYDGQWGLEPTYQEYLEHLWSMMDEVWRVLKPMGTVWINLGDSYSTQSGTNLAIARNADYKSDSTYLINRGESANLIKTKNLPNKSLLLLPHRFAIGCMDRGWILRNDIIWAKRNGMPESVRDRFSKKHEYMFFMVKQEKYYFDLDAVKKPLAQATIKRAEYDWNFGKKAKSEGYVVNGIYSRDAKTINKEQAELIKSGKHGGSNPGSVSDFWDIPTKPLSDKHFAMYNDVLITKPILAGCPEGGIIYDPFAGTGTTIACAMRAKRYGIGSEMSKEFCNIFERNISEIRDQVSLI